MNMVSNISDNSAQALSESLAMMLGSETFERAWRRQNWTSRNENPAPDKAEEFRNMSGDIAQNAQLLSFAHHFLSMQKKAIENKGWYRGVSVSANKAVRGLNHIAHKAVGREWHDEIAKNESFVHTLSQYLDEIAQDKILPQLEDLPEEDQKILKTLESKSANVGFWRGMGRIARHQAEDLCEHAWKSPLSTAFTAAAAWQIWTFMNVDLGGQTNEIEPSQIGFTGFPIPGAENTIYDSGITAEQARNIGSMCHNHVKQISDKVQGWGLSDANADRVTAPLSDFAAQHCTMVDTFTADTQDIIKSGFSFWTDRQDELFYKPVEAVVSQAPDLSVCAQAMMDGVVAAEPYIKGFDNWENAVIHGTLGVVHFLGARKLIQFDSSEIKESRDIIANLLVKNPVALPLSAAATTCSMMAGNGGMTSFWYGAGGLAAGFVGHHMARAFNRRSFAADLAQPAQQQFMNAIPAGMHSVKSNKELVKTFAVAAGVAAVAATPMAEMAGHLQHLPEYLQGAVTSVSQQTCNAAGVGFSWGWFGITNGPQDLAIHPLFAVLGTAAGLAYGGGERIVKYPAKKLGQFATWGALAANKKLGLVKPAHALAKSMNHCAADKDQKLDQYINERQSARDASAYKHEAPQNPQYPRGKAEVIELKNHMNAHSLRLQCPLLDELPPSTMAAQAQPLRFIDGPRA